MFCIPCGKPLAESAQFCAFCGAKVVIPGAETPGPAAGGPTPAGPASGSSQYAPSGAGQTPYASYAPPVENKGAAPRQESPARFDIAEFWKTHCSPILATHNESVFMYPEKWYAGISAGLPRSTIEKACKFIGGGSVLPDEVIAIICVSPVAAATASGRTGFLFCRDRFCYKAMPNPRDGYKGMLIGGPLYSAVKSAGKTSASIRYVDIASLSPHGEYLDVILKQGGKQTLYLGAHFNPLRTQAVFNELILALRS